MAVDLLTADLKLTEHLRTTCTCLGRLGALVARLAAGLLTADLKLMEHLRTMAHLRITAHLRTTARPLAAGLRMAWRLTLAPPLRALP